MTSIKSSSKALSIGGLSTLVFYYTKANNGCSSFFGNKKKKTLLPPRKELLDSIYCHSFTETDNERFSKRKSITVSYLWPMEIHIPLDSFLVLNENVIIFFLSNYVAKKKVVKLSEDPFLQVLLINFIFTVKIGTFSCLCNVLFI